MHDGGWPLPGLNPVGLLSTRQLSGTIHDDTEAAEIVKAGVNAHAQGAIPSSRLRRARVGRALEGKQIPVFRVRGRQWLLGTILIFERYSSSPNSRYQKNPGLEARTKTSLDREEGEFNLSGAAFPWPHPAHPRRSSIRS